MAAAKASLNVAARLAAAAGAALSAAASAAAARQHGIALGGSARNNLHVSAAYQAHGGALLA